MENNLTNTRSNIHLKSVLLLVGTAVLWSCGGLLIKLIKWNPIAIAGMRSLVSAMLMLCLLRKPKFRFSLNNIAGTLSYALTVTLFVSATKMTTAANAILLQDTAPIYVALFGVWFLNEKASIKDWFTICAIFIGMILFFFDNISGGQVLGNILALLSGVFFGFMAIFLRRQKDENPLESVFWGNILTGIISLPFIFTSPIPDTKSWAGLVLLGIFQLGVSYILYSIAIKHVTALEASIISLIEPILNPIWVFLIIGERPGKWALVGGFIVLLAVTFRCVKSDKIKN